jgi:8-oxo-dGTP diphosphatase
MSDAQRNPAPTVDVVIEVGADRRIVFIRRKNPPHGWALPGGFVDYGEKVPDAAVREAKEETGLDVRLVALLGVYSDPARDPRKHTLSVVYVGRADGEPAGADDAAEARLFDPGAPPAPLCFDHGRILEDYLRFREEGARPPVDR